MRLWILSIVAVTFALFLLAGCNQANSPAERQEKEGGIDEPTEKAQREDTPPSAPEGVPEGVPEAASPVEKPTYRDEGYVREAKALPDGTPIPYGITLGTVDQRGGPQMLDALILLPPEYHGNYDSQVVRAVADDVMATFEGGKIDTGAFDVVADVQMQGELGKDYTLKDWAKKADNWGTLTCAFTEDGVFMSGPRAGHWEFTGPEGFVTG